MRAAVFAVVGTARWGAAWGAAGVSHGAENTVGLIDTRFLPAIDRQHLPRPPAPPSPAGWTTSRGALTGPDIHAELLPSVASAAVFCESLRRCVGLKK